LSFEEIIIKLTKWLRPVPLRFKNPLIFHSFDSTISVHAIVARERFGLDQLLQVHDSFDVALDDLLALPASEGFELVLNDFLEWFQVVAIDKLDL
jgi:hypothetical protein